MNDKLATQRARLHLASRIQQAIGDWDWLDELWEKQPQTNEQYPFGLNRQAIVMEKLYGLTQPECNRLTQMVIKLEEDETAKQLLTSKLKI
jgi:hypothetical protein